MLLRVDLVSPDRYLLGTEEDIWRKATCFGQLANLNRDFLTGIEIEAAKQGHSRKTGR